TVFLWCSALYARWAYASTAQQRSESLPRKAQLLAHTGTDWRPRQTPAQTPCAGVLRAKAPRQPPALRLPAGTPGSPPVLGSSEGTVARPESEATCHAGGRSSARVRRFRGSNTRGLRRGHRDVMGSRHLATRE